MKEFNDLGDVIDSLEDGQTIEVTFNEGDNDHAVLVYRPLASLVKTNRDCEKTSVVLVMPLLVPGTCLFNQVLEFNYYPPLTPKNRDFLFFHCKFEGMLFGMIVIPRQDYDVLEIVAEQTGMAISKTPTLMIMGGRMIVFPVAGPNVYWLENATKTLVHEASEHALKKVIEGEYTEEQASDQVYDALKILFDRECDQLKQFKKDL